MYIEGLYCAEYYRDYTKPLYQDPYQPASMMGCDWSIVVQVCSFQWNLHRDAKCFAILPVILKEWEIFRCVGTLISLSWQGRMPSCPSKLRRGESCWLVKQNLSKFTWNHRTMETHSLHFLRVITQWLRGVCDAARLLSNWAVLTDEQSSTPGSLGYITYNMIIIRYESVYSLQSNPVFKKTWSNSR